MVSIELYIGTTAGQRVHFLNSIEEVRLFVENYGGGYQESKQIIGDLSMLHPLALSVLLKFLEEKVGSDISFYASKDSLNTAILSRFTKVVKSGVGLRGGKLFSDYAEAVKDGAERSSRVFYETCPEWLDKRALYNKLPVGLQARTGDLI